MTFGGCFDALCNLGFCVSCRVGIIQSFCRLGSLGHWLSFWFVTLYLLPPYFWVSTFLDFVGFVIFGFGFCISRSGFLGICF